MAEQTGKRPRDVLKTAQYVGIIADTILVSTFRVSTYMQGMPLAHGGLENSVHAEIEDIINHLR